MSFILDALKKSENERQRQSGPALFEVKVAAPRRGLPGWAVALGLLLLINAGVIAWLLLRHPTRATASSPAMPAVPPPAPAPAPVVQAPARTESGPANSADDNPEVAAQSAAGSVNPDDYAPATEPAAAQPPTPAANPDSHVSRATEEGLPTYEQVAGTAGLPDLRLDLHVYAAKPAERFVMINMHKLREGDTTPEGVRVESISNHGAVLAFRGTRFVLERQ